MSRYNYIKKDFSSVPLDIVKNVFPPRKGKAKKGNIRQETKQVIGFIYTLYVLI